MALIKKTGEKIGINTVIGGIAATLGGISALVLIEGYLILECYLCSINLDGVIQFSPEFLKIALIQFVIDGLSTPHLPVIAVLYLLTYSGYYLLFRKKLMFTLPFFGNNVRKIQVFRVVVTLLSLLTFTVLCAVAVSMRMHSLLVFGLLFPSLIFFVEYVITRNNDESYFIKPFFAIALFLLVTIPVLYGSSIFDIEVYLVEDIDTTQGEKRNLGENYYILDPRTSNDRELFISIGRQSKVILIDKKNIARLEINATGNKLRAFQQEVLNGQVPAIAITKEMKALDDPSPEKVDLWLAGAEMETPDKSAVTTAEHRLSGETLKSYKEVEKWMQN